MRWALSGDVAPFGECCRWGGVVAVGVTGDGCRGDGGVARAREKQGGRRGTNLCRNCPASRRPTVNWCNCDSRPVGGRFSWWIRALGSPPLCEQHCRRRRLPHRHPHRRPAASVPARFPICAETRSANTSLPAPCTPHTRTHARRETTTTPTTTTTTPTTPLTPTPTTTTTTAATMS